jgi:hypothetical protein
LNWFSKIGKKWGIVEERVTYQTLGLPKSGTILLLAYANPFRNKTPSL